MAKRAFVKWRYKDDLGVEYVRRADTFLTTQLDGSSNPVVGGSSAAGLTPYSEMPANLKPRYVTGADSGGYVGKIVIYDPAVFLALTSATTINVRDGGGTSHAIPCQNKIGEKPRGTILK
jgi:hypothetical protein